MFSGHRKHSERASQKNFFVHFETVYEMYTIKIAPHKHITVTGTLRMASTWLYLGPALSLLDRISQFVVPSRPFYVVRGRPRLREPCGVRVSAILATSVVCLRKVWHIQPYFFRWVSAATDCWPVRCSRLAFVIHSVQKIFSIYLGHLLINVWSLRLMVSVVFQVLLLYIETDLTLKLNNSSRREVQSWLDRQTLPKVWRSNTLISESDFKFRAKLLKNMV